MNFKLNIGKLNETINEYDKLINTLSSEGEKISNALKILTESGWDGEAKDKFLELHQKVQSEYIEFIEEVEYMKNALKNDEKPKAVQLKIRSEDFVNCIKRSGSGGSLTGNDEGIIILNGDSFVINNNVDNCTSNHYPSIQSDTEKIMNILSELEYTSFGINGEVWDCQMSLRNQTTSLKDFKDSFNVYCNDVSDMESNIVSVLSKISGITDMSVFKTGSIIPSNGEIDKDRMNEICKKSMSELTEEDKSFLEYSKIVLGEKKYNELIEEGIALSQGPTTEEAAIMAADVYSVKEGNGPLSGGWQIEGKPYIKGGLEMAVYSRIRIDGKKEYVMANAGTTPTSVSDWVNNVEQILGASEDVKNSLQYVDDFVKQHGDSYICCVGHSKGGAEAAINAVKFNLDAKVFNPATANLEAYGADKSKYSADMTAYIVKGEALNNIEGIISEPIGDVVYLPTQHCTYTASGALNIYNSINNHSMESVMAGLHEIGEK